MESTGFENKKNSKNFVNDHAGLWAILACLFFVTTVIFASLYFSKSSDYKEVVALEEKSTQDNQDLVRQLDSLKAEHARIKLEAGALADSLSEKDSLIMAQIAEIEGLMARQADYNQIKRKLDRVQKISEEYVHQMDSLITIQHELERKNEALNTELTQTKEAKATVEQQNTELTNKMNEAAKLTANNIRACCVRKKSNSKPEVETQKARDAERIKTTLTLAKNTLVPAGTYNIYCRISCPGDGHVLCQGKSDAYSFVNGEQRLQYSVKKSVNYVNQAETVTMYWDISAQDQKKFKEMRGTFILQVFSDNGLLGESRFTLE
jgi:myosin heavy subunit